MIRLQLFSSRKLTDSNDPFRASLQWTELTSKEPGDLVSARYWCCETYMGVTTIYFGGDGQKYRGNFWINEKKISRLNGSVL